MSEEEKALNHWVLNLPQTTSFIPIKKTAWILKVAQHQLVFVCFHITSMPLQKKAWSQNYAPKKYWLVESLLASMLSIHLFSANYKRKSILTINPGNTQNTEYSLVNVHAQSIDWWKGVCHLVLVQLLHFVTSYFEGPLPALRRTEAIMHIPLLHGSGERRTKVSFSGTMMQALGMLWISEKARLRMKWHWILKKSNQ